MKTPEIALIACAFIGVMASLGPLYLKYIRGTDYTAHDLYLDAHEFSYAAYNSALIDGQPRKKQSVFRCR